jgi:hypothetical protein
LARTSREDVTMRSEQSAPAKGRIARWRERRRAKRERAGEIAGRLRDAQGRGRNRDGVGGGGDGGAGSFGGGGLGGGI